MSYVIGYHGLLDKICNVHIVNRMVLFQDEEMDAIWSLINSAVLDPDVKGGLRWPLGKESFGDRYIVCGVSHTNSKTFRNSSIILKAWHADCFDFRTSTGEVTREANLKMLGIVSKLLVSFSHTSIFWQEMKKETKQILKDPNKLN